MSAMDLRLVLIESKEQKDKFKEIVEKYHSYVAHVRHVGRRLDYLIFLNDRAIGAIGLGTIPLPQGEAVLKYFEPLLGKTKGKGVVLKPIFNNIAENWRFCMSPEAPKNAGSRVLSVFCRLGKKDWKAKYGNDLMWILTYVERGHFGTVYRAAGWVYVGMTKGKVPVRDYKVRVSIGEKDFPDTNYSFLNKRKSLSGVNLSDMKDAAHMATKVVPKKKIFIKDLRKKGEGEAIVVQGEHAPPSSGEMAVTPTQSHHSYHTEVKGGKVRIVWD